MFTKHQIININNENILYLHISFDFEFAKLDMTNVKEKGKGIYKQILNYINEKKIDFNGTKVFLVVNGIVVGSIILSNPPYKDLKAEITPKYQYVEYIKDFAHAIEEAPTEKAEDTTPEKIREKTIEQIIKEEPTVPKIQTKNVKPKEVNPQPKAPAISSPKETATTPTPTQETPKLVEDKPIIESDIKVTLYRYNGTIEQISLEEYVIGVVAAEMPALFHSEALRAQAVAARTYALKRVNENKVLTDNNSHQVYKDNNQLKTQWGNNYETYYNRIKSAVLDTKGETVKHNGRYIDALYHSTSNGKTENAAEVWSNSYSYLVSINSPWDLNAPSYLRNTTLPINTVSQSLGVILSEESLIEVVERTQGNSVKTIKIDDNVFTGKFIREKLNLRSTDFDIKIEGNNVVFTTRGYGHGVGMSQYGANGMAKDGYTYKQILTHYYVGVSVSK
jgi:stage II sporulation protein D